jgi:hypothetical protein
LVPRSFWKVPNARLTAASKPAVCVSTLKRQALPHRLLAVTRLLEHLTLLLQNLRPLPQSRQMHPLLLRQSPDRYHVAKNRPVPLHVECGCAGLSF